jgi:hypothetical protein
MAGGVRVPGRRGYWQAREALLVATGEAERGLTTYLTLADRLVPGRVVGLYLVGSAALGGFRPGRSDIDFVAVVDGQLDARELRRLRYLHIVAGRGWSPTANTCNGVYVRRDDLPKPVSQIVPVASHAGRHFNVASGFDVNPVIWKELADHGVPIRGPAPESLGLQPEPDLLREWCLRNLSSYWRSWAQAVLEGRPHSGRLRPRWATAWATLGPPRLHCTIATGEVITKEAAGEYALDVFDARWHPLIRAGLAYRRGGRGQGDSRPASRRELSAFVFEVIGSAYAL